MGFILSLLGGSTLGFLGGILKGVMDYFSMREKNKHDLEMRRIDIEMMDKEWQYRERIATKEGEVQLQVSADALMGKSMDADAATYSKGVGVGKVGGFMLVLVDCVRGLIRPAITITMAVYMFMTYTALDGSLTAMSGNAKEAVLTAAYANAVDAILYLAVTCTGWWFGDRSAKQVLKK